MKVSQTYSQMITKAADFNTAAVNATKAWEGVTKIDTSKPYGGSSAGNSAFDSAMNNAGSSQTAGSPNIKPDTDYTLKLSDTDIYLTYSHIKKQLKATWSPKKPEHSISSGKVLMNLLRKFLLMVQFAVCLQVLIRTVYGA